MMENKISERDIRDIVSTKTNLKHAHLTRLYYALELSDAEIENAERNADTTDVRLRARKVLRAWLTKHGNEATRRKIIEALAEEELIEAQEQVELGWGIASKVLTDVTNDDIRYISYNTKLEYDGEMRNLFGALGMSKAEIENIESAARSKDVGSKATDVLTEWRMKNGGKASRTSIIDACVECNLGSTQRELEERWELDPRVQEQPRKRRSTEATNKPKKRKLQQQDQDTIDEWRTRLQKKYREHAGTIRFGGHRKDVADMDDIFVDLTLLEEKDTRREEEKKQDKSKQKAKEKVKTQVASKQKAQEKTLKSYHDIFGIPISEGGDTFAKHILVQGPAGIGKSTLLGRFAYMWAKNEHEFDDASVCTKEEFLRNLFELVFVIKLKFLKCNESLAKTIQTQLLPDVTEECIVSILCKLGPECLILLDGYDEIPNQVTDETLESTLLTECFVIVTTRPHLADRFCQSDTRSKYSHVRISGFSSQNTEKYIRNFFELMKQSEVGAALIGQIEDSPTLKTLSSHPILLVMLCLLWYDAHEEEFHFYSVTGLYENAVKYLNKPFQEQYKAPDLEKILLKLGETALESLFDNRVQIRSTKFDKEILDQSFLVGLLVKEDGSLITETFITFIHKTFQEFCAAKYLVNLYKSNNELFHSELRKIHTKNQSDMHYVLLFSCGLSIDAAQAILHHVIQIDYGISWYGDRKFCDYLLMLYESEINNPDEDTSSLHLELESFTERKVYSSFEIEGSMPFIAISHLALSLYRKSHLWLQYVKEIDLVNNTMKADTMVRLIGSMTELTSVSLQYVEIEGEIDKGKPVSCKSLTNVRMCSGSVSENTLLRILGCMPTLESVSFEHVIIRVEEDKSLSVSCKSLTNLSMEYGSVSELTVLRMLGCIPALISISLVGIEIRGEVDETVSVSCKSLTDLTMRGGSVSATTVLRILGCMPALRSISLEGIEIRGEVDETVSVSCKSLTNLTMRGGSVSATTVLRILGCMPALRSVSLYVLEVGGEVDETISVSCESLTNLTMKCGSVSATTVPRMLACMPALTSVSIKNVGVEGEVDNRMSISCNTSTELIIRKEYNDNEFLTLSANTIMSLLGCMPEVTSVSLSEVKMLDEEDESILSIPCKSPIYLIQDLEMNVVSVSANTLMKMLGCMPALTSVSLEGVEIGGEVDESILVSCKELNRLTIKGYHSVLTTLSANMMMKLLGCMPSLTSVSLEGVKIGGEVDESISVCCKALTNLTIKGYHSVLTTLSANTMMRLFGCMPDVKSVLLERVAIGGEVDESMSVYCNSLTDFTIVDMSVSANMMMRLLGCMPTNTSVTLYKVLLKNEVHGDISAVSCHSISGFTMTCISVGENTNMKLIGLMPGVASESSDSLYFISENGGCLYISCKSPIDTLTSRHVSMNSNTMRRLLGCMLTVTSVGTVNENILVFCKSLTEFRMKYISVTATTMIRMLGCIPGVISVSLGGMAIEGEVDEDISASCNSLSNFEMKNTSLSANTMMRLLDCMPAVKSVSLEGVKFIGEIDQSISCKSLSDFKMEDISVRAMTLMRLLSCMPTVSSVSLDSVMIKGDLDENISISCESLTKFTMAFMSVSAKNAIILLGFMPDLESVSLIDVKFEGELGENTSVSCKLLTEFGMAFMTVSANSTLGLLGCMPGVKSVSLDAVKLEGEVDKNISISCKSLTDLIITNTSLSEETMMQLLNVLPPEGIVKLDGAWIVESNGVGVTEDYYDSDNQWMGSWSARALMEMLQSIPPDH